MIDIIKADHTHVSSIKNLLEQLGYESEETGLISALELPHNESEAFVVVSSTKVVAFMSLIYFYYFPLQKHVCRITAIVVDKNLRNSGIGKKLIRFAATKAQSSSCVQLEVTTSLSREATQAYYEHLGFNKASLRYYLNIGN
ncbi:GNAT family N-acetyltransferase [Shewanella sp. Arc9-LZ]|jgi:ribosomal protein S18 acetylase RimI-like enzyme|uniref:GNAT family N-acetyltransferase n=1 Tax=Shewanella TaxID=22 RepID=UPI00137C3726|nr:GNAT family N-acetyltransferase [Shewanella sp. Arc9-LZ]QHS11997.1 GNAT family N-acetyltransferase [Shewanella sp. Arc9-LZ]